MTALRIKGEGMSQAKRIERRILLGADVEAGSLPGSDRAMTRAASRLTLFPLYLAAHFTLYAVIAEIIALRELFDVRGYLSGSSIGAVLFIAAVYFYPLVNEPRLARMSAVVVAATGFVILFYLDSPNAWGTLSVAVAWLVPVLLVRRFLAGTFQV